MKSQQKWPDGPSWIGNDSIVFEQAVRPSDQGALGAIPVKGFRQFTTIPNASRSHAQQFFGSSFHFHRLNGVKIVDITYQQREIAQLIDATRDSL